MGCQRSLSSKLIPVEARCSPSEKPGETNGAVKLDKAQYMKSILSVITLIMNHKHVTLGDRFNQRVFFRLLSSILCDWHDFGREGYSQDRDMLIVFADNFLDLAPHFFAGFTYSWLMLVSHRFFMPSILRLANSEVSYGASFEHSYTDFIRAGNHSPVLWKPHYHISVNS